MGEEVLGLPLPWGLHDNQTSKGKQAAHNALHSQWDSPRGVTVYKATEVVYPDGCGVPNNVAGKFYASKLSSVMWRRNLRLVDRNDGGQGTNAHTSNDSAQHHHGHACREGLQGASDEEDHGAIEDGAPSTNDVSNFANEKRRYEGTNFEDGDHSPYLGPRGLVEVVLEERATGHILLVRNVVHEGELLAFWGRGGRG